MKSAAALFITRPATQITQLTLLPEQGAIVLWDNNCLARRPMTLLDRHLITQEERVHLLCFYYCKISEVLERMVHCQITIKFF